MSSQYQPLRLSKKEPLSNAIQIDTLGSGAFGSVVKLKKKNSFFGQVESAVKFIAHGDVLELREDEDKTSYKIMREVLNATRSGHPNLVLSHKFGYTTLTPQMIKVYMAKIDSYTSSASDSVLLRNPAYLLDNFDCIPALWIGMEMCGPTLTTWLNQEIPLDGMNHYVQKIQLGIVRGLVEGLTFLHARGVIHRDLKPDNIFFSNRKGFVLPVKIGDLGLSRSIQEIKKDQENTDLDDNALLSGRIGTPSYMAPEITGATPFAANEDNKFKPDLFSLGLIIWEVLQLIREENRKHLFQSLKRGQIDLVKDHAIISNAKDIILHLTHPDPNKRCGSVYDIKLETRTCMTFLAQNSAEFHNFLEICADGDTIYLASGEFVGEFDLNRNNVIIQGSSKDTVITSRFIGLFVEGDGNTIRNITFKKCYVCVQLNGCHNKVHDLHLEFANIGIMAHKIPQPFCGSRKCGSFNEICDIFLDDVDDGLLIYGDSNKIMNIVFKPMWRDNSFSKCTAVQLFGGSCFVDGVKCIGLNYRVGDFGFKIWGSLSIIRNCKSGPIKVDDCDVKLQNVEVKGAIELKGDKYKLVNCIADEINIKI